MERFEETAVVLSTLDYADADRLVTLFTRSHGKLTAFAVGARKSKRRFAGALQPFTLLRAQLVERRGDTFRLDAADIQETFHRIREDLPRIARALYCLELCRESPGFVCAAGRVPAPARSKSRRTDIGDCFRARRIGPGRIDAAV